MPESTRFWNPFNWQLSDWHFNFYWPVHFTIEHFQVESWISQRCISAPCPNFQVFKVGFLVDLFWCFQAAVTPNLPLLLYTLLSNVDTAAFNLICRCCIQHPGSDMFASQTKKLILSNFSMKVVCALKTVTQDPLTSFFSSLQSHFMVFIRIKITDLLSSKFSRARNPITEWSCLVVQEMAQ